VERGSPAPSPLNSSDLLTVFVQAGQPFDVEAANPHGLFHSVLDELR
jgi:hypothetical protein